MGPDGPLTVCETAGGGGVGTLLGSCSAPASSSAPSLVLRATVPPVQGSPSLRPGMGMAQGRKAQGARRWPGSPALPQPTSSLLSSAQAAMGSVGSQRLKEPSVAGTPDRSVVMSFSFDSCRPEEEGTAGTAQGQGVPGFTDSGECVWGGPEPGWAVRTFAEPWAGGCPPGGIPLPWGRSSRCLCHF